MVSVRSDWNQVDLYQTFKFGLLLLYGDMMPKTCHSCIALVPIHLYTCTIALSGSCNTVLVVQRALRFHGGTTTQKVGDVNRLQ